MRYVLRHEDMDAMPNPVGIPVRGSFTGRLYVVLARDDPLTIAANQPEVVQAAMADEDHWYHTEQCTLINPEMFDFDPGFLCIQGCPFTSRAILLKADQLSRPVLPRLPLTGETGCT